MNGPILVRADAGPAIGLGHIMRCLALAQALRDAGGEVQIACHELPSALRPRLEAEGCAVLSVAAPPGSHGDADETREGAARLGARWVVLDGYRFGAEYGRRLRSGAARPRVLWLDDGVSSGPLEADLVLDQSLGATPETYLGRVADGVELLLGPRFALLRREVLRARRGEPDGPVVVSFGGADPSGLTLRTLTALAHPSLAHLEAIVVVGPAFAGQEALRAHATALGPRVRFIENPPDMGTLLAGARACVGAAGSTIWELAYLGVPGLVTAVADNQRDNARRAAEAGFVVDLGREDALGPEQLVAALLRLDGDPVLRRRMMESGSRVVDGAGARRVAQRLLRDTAGTRLRPLEAHDRDRLRTWRNLPDVARYMRTAHRIEADEHARWFERILRDPSVAYWVIELDGEPVGLANVADIDRDTSRCSLGLYLASPSARGRGVGRAALAHVARHVFEDLALGTLGCEVLAFNAPALKLYRASGFVEDGRLQGEVVRDGVAHDLVLLSLRREDWEAAAGSTGGVRT